MPDEQVQQEQFVTIDNGTVNVEVSDEKGNLLPLEGSNAAMPSIITFDEAGKPHTGTVARRMAAAFPDRSIADCKRYIGKEEPVLVFPGGEYTAYQLIVILATALYKIICQLLGCTRLVASVTCPAYFDNVQRLALKSAFEEAGFRVLGLIDEPVAAAAYALSQHVAGQKVMVCDIGGGTADYALLECLGPNAFRVLAKKGSRDLAGGDLTRILVDEALKRATGDSLKEVN